MFHKSLSEVPPGLTPIRTRSDDFEMEVSAAGRDTAPSVPVCFSPMQLQAAGLPSHSFLQNQFLNF